MTPLPEVARLLEQDYFKLWPLVVRGEIPGVKIGGRWFIRTRVLRELLEHRNDPTPEAVA